MNTTPEILIVGVNEKDIDLLLLEEFVASPEFSSWFLVQLGINEIKLISVGRGVSDSTGESDLLLTVEALDGSKSAIHIENKISASFQPQQQERYAERGAGQVRKGDVVEFYLCLVAPSSYLGSEDANQEFDLVLSYEAIREWFHKSDLGENRRAYKSSLLTKAIEKATIGYQPKEDQGVTLFWKRYWERSREIAPMLQMNKPGGVPSRSSFVYFPLFGLPAGLRLVHKMAHGIVDLQIAGWATRLFDLAQELQERLEPEMRILKAEKSAVIRVEVPILYLNRPFDEQIESVDKGLEVSRRLYKWHMANRDVIVATLEKGNL